MGYRTQSMDTPREVEQIVFEGYRRMSPSQKLQRMVELSRASEALARAGLRARQPELDDEALALKLAEGRLGSVLLARVLAHRSAR